MSGRGAWSAEEEAWLRESYPTMNADELTASHRELFGFDRTDKAVKSRAKLLGLRKAEGFDRSWRNRTWTAEEDEWFRAFVPGHTEAEISAEHERLFGTPLTEGQIGNRKHDMGLRSGTHGGRWQRGHVPANKGRRWSDYMGEGQIARLRASGTMFEPGHMPHNTMPLLSVKETKDGYLEIKVRERPRPGHKVHDQWMPYAAFCWERENGPWPEGCRCVFADHDNRNFDPDNIVPVPAELYPIVQGAFGGGIEYHDRESLELAVAYARVVHQRAQMVEQTRRHRNGGRG